MKYVRLIIAQPILGIQNYIHRTCWQLNAGDDDDGKPQKYNQFNATITTTTIIIIAIISRVANFSLTFAFRNKAYENRLNRVRNYQIIINFKEQK
uniref:Uncharacterized protein n=1 Tax=Glossina brevipalpis TaxID=37001 RepID=A0A1A9W773_9MUSC